MQTIGEKLEEARKRRGISIREASEVTKIRSDYLASFESNSFDLNVPAIYVRGFLRAYAQFLKLNPDKIITDFNAHQLGESKFARRESREFLGRMDIHNSDPEEEPTVGEPAPAGQAAPAISRPSERGFDYRQFDKASLLKGGVAVASACLLIVVIVFLVLAVLKSGPEAMADGSGATPSSTMPKKEMTILAEGGDILSVIVAEVATGREIYRGPLAQGEVRTIAFDEQVRLTYTHAEYLFIEQDGLRYSIGGRGMRQSTFPRKQQQL